VVLSPAAYNVKTGLTLCCPITSQVKGYPLEVAVEGDASVSGVILADQVKSLDWRVRQARRKGRVTPAVTKRALARVMALLA
jgi:mRNA interferase MazF